MVHLKKKMSSHQNMWLESCIPLHQHREPRGKRAGALVVINPGMMSLPVSPSPYKTRAPSRWRAGGESGRGRMQQRTLQLSRNTEKAAACFIFDFAFFFAAQNASVIQTLEANANLLTEDPPVFFYSWRAWRASPPTARKARRRKKKKERRWSGEDCSPWHYCPTAVRRCFRQVISPSGGCVQGRCRRSSAPRTEAATHLWTAAKDGASSPPPLGTFNPPVTGDVVCHMVVWWFMLCLIILCVCVCACASCVCVRLSCSSFIASDWKSAGEWGRKGKRSCRVELWLLQLQNPQSLKG